MILPALGLFAIIKAPAQTGAGLFDVNTIQQLTFSIVEENWRTQLDSLHINGGDYLVGDLTINGKVFKDCGLRYGDARTFALGSARNSLHLKLDLIHQNQQYEGYSTLELSSALRDPSLVREVLGFEIARQYFTASKANYAQLTVNGKDQGLFVNVEPIGNVFLLHNYGVDTGALFRCTPDVSRPAPAACLSGAFGSLQADNGIRCYRENFELLSGSGWTDLLDLTEVLNKEQGRVSEVLDVDAVLWMHAFNNITVNLSSYLGHNSQNYFLYQDSTGRFSPVIWDLNLAFGGYKNTGEGSDLDLKGLQQLDPQLHAMNKAKPLISQLLSNETYNKIYFNHLRTILEEQFLSGRYEERARELQALIQPAFAKDPNQYYSPEEFGKSLTETVGSLSKIPGLVELMDRRANFLKKHPELAFFPPEIEPLPIPGRPGLSAKGVDRFNLQVKVNRFPKTVKVRYRFAPDQPYLEASLYDDGAHQDAAAGDHIYGVSIPALEGQTEIQYYFVSENAKAISFAPSAYLHAPFTATLEALNK